MGKEGAGGAHLISKKPKHCRDWKEGLAVGDSLISVAIVS